MFSLRITLDEVTPSVWRRLLVPGSIRLAKLHDVFRAAMGWTDAHLHCFTIGGERFGPQFDDYPEDAIDENELSVLQAIREHRRFSYEYDFGDSWEHDIVVEQHVRLPHGLKHIAEARCINPGDLRIEFDAAHHEDCMVRHRSESYSRHPCFHVGDRIARVRRSSRTRLPWPTPA